MAKKKAEKEDFKDKMAKKVPSDIAGSVLIAIVFIATSPFILERLKTEAEIFCYLLFLGIISFCILFPVSLHAISKYHERERKLLLTQYQTPSPRQDIDAVVISEIKKAAESMEDDNDGER